MTTTKERLVCAQCSKAVPRKGWRITDQHCRCRPLGKLSESELLREGRRLKGYST